MIRELKTRRSCFGFAALFLVALSSCGEGYRLEPAVIDVSEASDVSKSQLLTTVSRFLKQQGFDYLGRNDRMIALLQQQPESMANNEVIAQLRRQLTFLTPAEDLRVEWMDYVDTAPPKGSLSYAPPSDHFVELSITETRPGGFSARGERFFEQFLTALRQDYGNAVVVAKQPPPDDEATYRRITTGNNIVSGFWLSICVLISLLLTGSLSVYVLKRVPLSPPTRRIVFTLVNFWLIAPMPSPTTIVVIPIPNMLLFPWTDLDYYHHFARFAVWSFSCTLLLCAAVSIFCFRIDGTTELART